MDAVTRAHRLERRRLTLPCERCGGRIAWMPHVGPRRWRWQGSRTPIRWTGSRYDRRLEARCFRCGWQDTYTVDELGKVMR